MTPPRIKSLAIKNLRSIGDPGVKISLPAEGTLVLLGENNAGKSNITRGLDILFGESWPGSRRLDEHDFHARDSDGIAVEVTAVVSGFICSYCQRGEIEQFKWTYDPQSPAQDGNPVTYRLRCNNPYCDKTYVSNQVRSSLSAAVLDADRRLDYQLSYASKFTMLSKLMHRFHERLLNNAERKDKLTSIFGDLQKKFSEVPEFAAFKQLLADTADDFGQNLPYRLEIDFSAYDPSNFFRSLRVHPTLSGEVRSFDELGTGQSQVLALAFAYAYARAYGRSEGTILVIDEPEANLHPLAQQWLATRLNNLAAPGLQVVVTTHSPHFVDLSKPENLVMVSKAEDGATRVIQRTLPELRSELVKRGSDPTRTQTSSIGPFYAAGATTEIVSGLFSRRCVLVEGPTEALVLPELLRSRGLDVLKEGIAVVSVEGIGNIAKWHRLYTALGIKTFCVFDTDSDKPQGKEAKKLSRQRGDIAAALGLEGDPAQTVTPGSTSLVVDECYAMMNPNFEGAISALFGDTWLSLYDEATESVGESKSLRARYAAQRLKDSDYLGTPAEHLDALIDRILRKPKDETPSGEWSQWDGRGSSPAATDPGTWPTSGRPEQGPSWSSPAPNWGMPQQGSSEKGTPPSSP